MDSKIIPLAAVVISMLQHELTIHCINMSEQYITHAVFKDCFMIFSAVFCAAQVMAFQFSDFLLLFINCSLLWSTTSLLIHETIAELLKS